MHTDKFTGIYPNEYSDDYKLIRERKLIKESYTDLNNLNPNLYKSEKSSIFYDSSILLNGINIVNNINKIVIKKLFIEFHNNFSFATDKFIKLRFNDNIDIRNVKYYNNNSNVNYVIIYLPSTSTYDSKNYYNDLEDTNNIIELNINTSRLSQRQNYELKPIVEIYDSTSSNIIDNFIICFDIYYDNYK